MKQNIIKSILCSLLIVALLAAPVSALAASNVAYILKVAVSDAPGTYIRSGDPSDGNAVIGSLKNGAKVVYCGSKIGQMLQVLTESGQVGYVYQGNLKTYGAMSTRQLYITTASATVYRKSGASLSKAGTVGAGFPVFVCATNGGWAYVRSVSGAAAYMQMSSLKSFT